MKKTWLLIALLTLVISMLAACNSKDESTSKDEPNTQVETEETKDVEVIPEEDENEQEQPVTEERGTDKILTYLVSGEVKEDSAKLTESDEQNYSIYKLDEFSLTGEEPNKDALFLEENSAVFMRIETISKDEASYEIIANNMKETMAAVTFGKEPLQISDKEKLPQGEGISNQIGYEMIAEIGTVTGIVFEKENLIVRLTIFDRNAYNLTDAFLKMGETIAEKQ
ncbi:hypothetical protein [Paenisporosarcina sp. TG-14]|uniref:hypothetical protein n=1 Tax=Paenisporosarcina sp. TG-14 TaxID=1231057 RepID=UPI0002DA39FE|nr:hypothetical protein [Paenisporosarcina sp. TG-14]